MPKYAALYRELLSSQPLDAWITTQVANQGLATCLSDLNVSREMLHQLAKEASTQWDRAIQPDRVDCRRFRTALSKLLLKLLEVLPR